ncbi:MAG: hypothetical protein PHG87_07690 [Candidatus Omnitrophica bacterium]|nr:hypothetical protein [Candidatus Omnitrophota bacterium]
MFHFSSINSFAQTGRIIEESEVSKVDLHMFYDFGKFSGYLIFYDKEANQCAVNIIPKAQRDVGGYYVNNKPRLVIESRMGTSVKELEITPDKFQVLTLRNGNQVYAYGIDFLPPFEIKVGDEIQFKFASYLLTATAESKIAK